MCSSHTPKYQGRDCEDPRGRCRNEVGNIFLGNKCLGKIFSYQEIQELLPQRHPEKIVPILNYWTYASMCLECIQDYLEFQANHHGFQASLSKKNLHKDKQKTDLLYD